MFAFLLALVSPSLAPATLSATAACSLAKADRIKEQKALSIRGSYSSDYHGAIIELPHCKAAILPTFEQTPQARIDAYRMAIEEKCGVVLIGVGFEGVFTGRFARWKRGHRFEVTAIKTDDLETASIACPH